jgi:hypothetical protein
MDGDVVRWINWLSRSNDRERAVRGSAFCRNPRRLAWVPTLRPSSVFKGLGCRLFSFKAHLWSSYVHCDLPVRLQACSPPRLATTQLARSAVLNRLIAQAGLSPVLTPASRAHQKLRLECAWTCRPIYGRPCRPSGLSLSATASLRFFAAS